MLVFMLAVGLVAPAASNAEEDSTLSGVAAELYDPTQVQQFKLTIPNASQVELATAPKSYVPAALQATVDGKSYGPTEVELKLKGSVGSFRPLGEKAAFRIKFPSSDEIFGLSELTLNNMVQDPSMVHETLAYQVFRAAGVPAPDTGFAYVQVNGVAYGLYLDIEPYDSQTLDQIFDTPTQHLYSPDTYGVDVTTGSAGDFEVTQGSSSDTTDLQNLIDAVNYTPTDGATDPSSSGWSTAVAPYVDLPEMTLMWAGEQFMGQWDGYSLRDVGSDPNNYYIRSDDNGQFTMLPWGLDQTFQFGSKLVPDFPGDGGILIQDCLANASCTSQFEAALETISSVANGNDLGSSDNDIGDELNAIAATVAPWVNCPSLDPISDARWQAAVLATRDFIRNRWLQLAMYLGPSAAIDEPALDTDTLPSVSAACPVGEGTTPVTNPVVTTPKLKVLKKTAQLTAGARELRLPIACTGSLCTGGLALAAAVEVEVDGRRVERLRTIGAAGYKLAAGRRATITIHVNKLGRALAGGTTNAKLTYTLAHGRGGTVAITLHVKPGGSR